jgi:hypothetical protein
MSRASSQQPDVARKLRQQESVGEEPSVLAGANNLKGSGHRTSQVTAFQRGGVFAPQRGVSVGRERLVMIGVLCAAAILVSGCGSDPFSRLAVGDCVEGALTLAGGIEIIDCESEAEANRATHYRVVGVGTRSEPPPAQGISCVRDGDRANSRVVCFEKFR